MKLALAILCLFLTSCESLWLSAYRYKGGWYDRKPKPENYISPEEAAANVLPRPGSSQPTYF